MAGHRARGPRGTADRRPHTNAGLAALREVTKGLEKAQRQGTPSATLQREQLRLESAVRARALQARAGPGSRRAAFGVIDLLDELGSTRLIQIAEIDDIVHVLVCGEGRVRQFTAGRARDAAREADFARFALRPASRPADDISGALAILKAAGPKLQEALLGPAVRHLGSGPRTVPPAKFHAIPWALLPALLRPGRQHRAIGDRLDAGAHRPKDRAGTT